MRFIEYDTWKHNLSQPTVFGVVGNEFYKLGLVLKDEAYIFKHDDNDQVLVKSLWNLYTYEKYTE